MLATAALPHDAISQKRTKTRPSDAGLSAIPTVQIWRAAEAGRYTLIGISSMRKYFVKFYCIGSILIALSCNSANNQYITVKIPADYLADSKYSNIDTTLCTTLESIDAHCTLINLGKRVGIIFNSELNIPLEDARIESRFTPSQSLVISLENEFKRQYFGANVRALHNQYFNEQVISSTPDREERCKWFLESIPAILKSERELHLFDRQYFGFVNQKNERIIVIRLVNFFNDPNHFKPILGKSWFLGSGQGSWFESNIQVYEYNIDKCRLNVYGKDYL